jgi:uncharacterized peroxidase-related enzyme
MTFIKTVSEKTATGETRAFYERTLAEAGRLSNLHRSFSHRPEYMEAWETLIGAIRARMDARLYELVTLAAATALRSSYCSLAHGEVLLRDLFTPDELLAILADHNHADLLPVDIAAMDYARAIALDASSVRAEQIEALRAEGLTDAEVTDIAAAAAARAFFSKFLDALGTHPDAHYADLPARLQDRLAVGRSIEKRTGGSRPPGRRR